MALVKWLTKNPASRRLLKAKDFEVLGVAHDKDEIFSRSNEFMVSMTDEAAATLQKMLPKEFVALELPEGSVDDDESTDKGDEVKPEGKPDEGESAPADNDDDSPVNDDEND